MRLTKTFKFYAAHRNQHLDGKCRNIHGHRYSLEVQWMLQSPDESGVSTLFEAAEEIIQPIVHRYDHALLLDANDPCAQALLDSQACGKVVMMNGATSVENLCLDLYEQMVIACVGTPLESRLIEITVRETDSSAISLHAVEYAKHRPLSGADE